MKRYGIVTIERQYGSGGRQVGETLAGSLGIPFYDRAILEQAAANLRAAPDHMERLEETGTNSLLYSLVMAGQVLSMNEAPLSPGEKLFYEQSNIIRAAAMRGPCVIIGRAAGFVLRDEKHCLNVFLYASWEDRIRRCVEVYGHTEAEAVDTMKRIDKNRAAFYRSVADRPWDGREGYGLMLNTSEVGIDGCAEILASLCERDP